MKIRSYALMSLVLCAVVGVAQAVTPLAPDKDRILQALNGVCGWALTHPGSGLEVDRSRLDPFLAPALIADFEQAKAAEAEYVKAAAPGEKPEFLEGDLIVGSVEGATEVALGEPRIDGAHAHVEVTAIYIDERFPKASRNRVVVWTNIVELERVGHLWQVSDVQYHGDPKQRLSTALREYAAGR